MLTFPRPSFEPPLSQREWAQCRQHHGRRIAFTREAIRYGEVSHTQERRHSDDNGCCTFSKDPLTTSLYCMLSLQLHTDKYCILPCLPSIIHFLSSCHSLCTKITLHLGTLWFQVSGWWSNVMKSNGYWIFSIVTKMRFDLWSLCYFMHIFNHDQTFFLGKWTLNEVLRSFSLTVRRTCTWPLCYISKPVNMVPWLQLSRLESSCSEDRREFSECTAL